ncbi:hypothetical protein ACJ41P_10265 [Azospirillum argentinense]|uniref:Uncharacterized protein n=1 Tax=Azospirillum argentinense TaxID=2970906 RepID=A0ABW8V560_9PROT
MPQRAYEVRSAVDGYREPHTVYAETIGKARYKTLMNAMDAGYDISFRDIKVRSLGIKETPHEQAVRERDAFNASYPIGTPIRAYPGAKGDESCAYDTVVLAPGAYIPGGIFGNRVSVKVPGDSIAITHVVPLVPIATPSQD